jgi:hypothetical protein
MTAVPGSPITRPECLLHPTSWREVRAGTNKPAVKIALEITYDKVGWSNNSARLQPDCRPLKAKDNQ